MLLRMQKYRRKLSKRLQIGRVAKREDVLDKCQLAVTWKKMVAENSSYLTGGVLP